MGKIVTGLIVVAGLWVGVEFFTYGPSRAFDGAFAGFFKEGTAEPDTRSTAQRASGKVEQSQAAATARRERLLSE